MLARFQCKICILDSGQHTCKIHSPLRRSPDGTHEAALEQSSNALLLNNALLRSTANLLKVTFPFSSLWLTIS